MVVYAAENHNRAAEILEEKVREAIPAAERKAALARVRFLNTVIGKMSGRAAAGGDLVSIAPGAQHAFLVESFNRILTDRVRRPDDAAGGRELDPDWAGFRSGIPVFDSKPDLVPFAEAKLYGHNAGHALAAYLARLLGFTWMHQLRERADLLTVVVEAMANESGTPLARRHAGVDPLFAPGGFRAHARDLVERMVNPFVRDTVARVGRDPARKLGWNDRLIGAMRLALEAGIEPRRYAWGAAAALDALGVSAEEASGRLLDIWRPAAPLPEHSSALLAHIGPPVIGCTLGEREAVRYSASNEAACPSGGFHASGQSHGAEGDAAG
jgi:mannitol-1-phosphate 5-dehydrogenase